MISNDKTIDQRIVELKKEGVGLIRLQKWLLGWESFSQLDEQVVLAHILNVMADNNIKIKRSEIRRCFNLYYKKEFHGNSQGYLKWLYSLYKENQKKLINSKKIKEVGVGV